MVDRYLQRAYVEVRVVRQLDNVETIKRAVEAGTGISIVPRSAVTQELRDGALAAVTLADPGLQRPVALIYRKGRPLETATERLIEVLREEI
jgi:DNA-binding transcriptional LysR family regulator